jgi:hypothetical protein
VVIFATTAPELPRLRRSYPATHALLVYADRQFLFVAIHYSKPSFFLVAISSMNHRRQKCRRSSWLSERNACQQYHYLLSRLRRQRCRRASSTRLSQQRRLLCTGTVFFRFLLLDSDAPDRLDRLGFGAARLPTITLSPALSLSLSLSLSSSSSSSSEVSMRFVIDLAFVTAGICVQALSGLVSSFLTAVKGGVM